MATKMNKEVLLDEWEDEPKESKVPEESENELSEGTNLSMANIRIVITDMITRPKPKGSIPTFVTFREQGHVPERHVILDVPEPFLKEAWLFYKESRQNPTAEEFLIEVYEIMKKGIPRLYRKVAKLNLD